MHLKTVFTRFYKSFNDDFLRKNDDRVKPKPWEKVGNAFYPYIEVPIDQKITTIVGANESGKSHLLTAIEKAISGKSIDEVDEKAPPTSEKKATEIINNPISSKKKKTS